jgi:hypothetical protein
MIKTGAKSTLNNLLSGDILNTINSGIGTLGILGKVGLENIGISSYTPE